MAITLELLDDDVTIESKNIILNDAEVDELSFNVTIPVNSFNKEQVNLVSNNSLNTSHKCLVNIGNNNWLGKFNIDSYNVQENTLDCTLYPNKQVFELLATPIQQLLIDQPQNPLNWNDYWDGTATLFPFTAFSYLKAFEQSGLQGYITPQYSNWLESYNNGANGNYGVSRSYHSSWYNPEFDDDDFIKYQTQGCGAYKNYMYHPSIDIRSIVTNLNEWVKIALNVTQDIIILPQSLTNIKLICGYEKCSPYTRSQWCSWILGERASSTSTHYNNNERDNFIPIEVLGTAIQTQESDDYQIVFDRDCQIQFQSIHLYAEAGVGPNDAKVELVLKNSAGADKQVLFSKTFDEYAGQYTALWTGVQRISSPLYYYSFIYDPINNPVVVKKGDKLVLRINCSMNKKARVQYLATMIKWDYVADSFVISDDDWDVDLKYWSGILTELKDVDNVNYYLNHQSPLAKRKALRKVYDKTLTEILMDSEQNGYWLEPFVPNYYGFMMNLGELTPLQLLSYYCLVVGCDLFVNGQGQLVVNPNAFDKPMVVQDAELTSIDYLNDKFAYFNYIKYGDDSQILVGVSNNPNTSVSKNIFETDNVLTPFKMMIKNFTIMANQYAAVRYFPHSEQEGDIKEEGSVKMNEIGNGVHFDSTFDITELAYFDELFKYNDPKYTYHFKVYSVIPWNNVISINGIRYMILSRKVKINEEITEIDCIQF